MWQVTAIWLKHAQLQEFRYFISCYVLTTWTELLKKTHMSSPSPAGCNSGSCPHRGASAKCAHQVVHLRQPVVFLSTREEWNFSLWSSSKVELLHPEWGMITVLVSVVKASLMIVILMASHDDRFHTTPVETPARKHRHWEADTHTSGCAVRLTQQRKPQLGLLIAQCVHLSTNKQTLTRTHKWRTLLTRNRSSITASDIHL